LKHIIFILAFCCFSQYSYSQNGIVSLIGDNETEYEQTISECPSLLLSVADNSMDKAYSLWTDMLSEAEKQASLTGLDLKGAKIWINLFWEADGSIKSIVYYPKPNSKNMDFTQVTSFFEDFAQNYTLPQNHSGCFSHYGSASFPVHRKLAINNEK